MDELLKHLQQVGDLMKQIIANQERFCAELEQAKCEQGRAAVALGEVGTILLDHASSIKKLVAHAGGVPLKDTPSQAPPIVN